MNNINEQETQEFWGDESITDTNEEYGENISIEKEFGSWCEKSMSNDLMNMTDIISIILELYQNAESAKASNITFKLNNGKLLITDNGNGMDSKKVKDYLSAKKDIYNRRNINIQAETMNIHSFGGEGGKKALGSLYKNKCLILISPKNTLHFHIIIYDISKSWGSQFQNPTAYLNVDSETLYDIDMSRRMSDLITEESSPIYSEINKIKETSGVIIYGDIEEKFEKNFNGKNKKISVTLQDKCNNNLENCSITINNKTIKYQKETIRDEDIEITEMKIWGKDNKDNFTITFTNKIDKKNYYNKDKEKKYTEFKPKKNVKCLGTFKRIDKLIRGNIELLREKYLFRSNDKKYNILDTYKEKKIKLKRLGTILNTFISKKFSNTGDVFYKNIDYSYVTHYEWNPNQVVDRLFGISADKLNPNVQDLKNRCTNASYELLKNVNIKKYIEKQFKEKNYLLCTTYSLFNDCDKKDKTKIIRIQSTVRSRIVRKQWYQTKQEKIKQWHQTKQKKLNDSIKIAVDISRQAEIDVNKAVILVENEEHMNSLYIRYTMTNIYALKNAMDQIYEDMDSLQYTLIPNCNLFYYKLNTPLDTQGHLLLNADLLIEGEIGYTSNSIQRRHPKANIQFIQYINKDGSIIQKGGKTAVEKAVIENIKNLPCIDFGNKDHPNSKEIFRFPYTKIQEVREKIENTVIRYKAHGDIFKLSFN